jgi:hypothetical protein
MPRNGSGVLSAPAGTLGTPNTVIESAKYNAFVNDWVSDGNAARPITAGGTGGITAVAGADNLSTKGTDIPSAATTDIGAATGRYVHITGTTTITGLGTKTAGVLRIVTFDGILTLTHNATSLILPGAANIITAAGDVASFVSEGGGNWRCVSYSRASGGALVSGVYLSKAANYTTVDADYDANIRFSAAATLSIDVTANLRSNWRERIWADGGQVIIDPNSTDTINGTATLVLQQGQKALIYKTGATTFQADVYSDAMSGPQIQGYSSGLAVTTNVADATNDVDIAVGVAAADVSPYNLMQLTSALTKRIDSNWVVGTNQGGLDTGAVANSVYYVWLIQRSDTLVTDVLFSLSATAPTMPTSYDRKRLIGSLSRVSASNTGLYSQLSTLKSLPPLVLNTLTEAPFLLPAGTRVARIYFDALSPSGTVAPQAQIGTASAYAVTGYTGSTVSIGTAGTPVNTSSGVPLAGAVAAATSIQGYVEFANIGGNKWLISGVAGADNAAFNVVYCAVVTLADVATRVRLSLSSTTFDNGTAFATCM